MEQTVALEPERRLARPKTPGPRRALWRAVLPAMEVVGVPEGRIACLQDVAEIVIRIDQNR
ncbi:MAG TPA: hypothetical protein VGW38_29095 [Chloroflexota bacterium]|nr:hypothetical protein [Chloroflexota bacterium]